MKFKTTSSNPRVTSSTWRVMSSNPRVTSSNPQVTSFSTWYKCWLIWQRLFISAPSPPSLCFCPLSDMQPNQKDTFKSRFNSRMYQYINAVLILIFYQKYKKSDVISFASQRNFKQTFDACLFFYELLNIEGKNEWIRLLNKLHWLKMQVMLTYFCNNYLKYSFVNFLNIFLYFNACI